MFLSQEKVRFFRHNGYLKLPYTIPEELIEEMYRVIEFHSESEIAPFSRNDVGQIRRLDNLVERDVIFSEVFASQYILDPLQSLLGPNIEMTLNRHNHATFNRAGDNVVRLHRDVLQWSRSVVTVIVYLDDSHLKNGCTCLIPGSQFLPFVGTPNNGGTWMDEHSVYADLIEQSLPVPMIRGGILFFDSLIFHSATENFTNKTRLSVCFAYHSVDELSGLDSDPKKVLVRGEKLYRGNDLAGNQG